VLRFASSWSTSVLSAYCSGASIGTQSPLTTWNQKKAKYNEKEKIDAPQKMKGKGIGALRREGAHVALYVSQ
jgi:hypothetical protein